MPIPGLTDRTPSFKEIGRLRLGIPKNEAQKSGPREISYFRADFRPDAADAFVSFVDAYGDKPTSINVRLPFPEIVRCWDAFYEVYNTSGMLGQADGEKWLYLRNNKTGELIVKDGVPSNATGLPTDASGMPYMPFDKTVPVYSYKSGKGQDVAVYAKPTGKLKILIPELKRAAYVLVVTHSVYNIMKISEQLAAISDVSKNVGMSLSMVPMILTRRQEKISVSIGGKKTMQEKYLLNIEISPAWMEAQFQMLDGIVPGHLLAAPQKPLEIPATVAQGVTDAYDDEDAFIVNGEQDGGQEQGDIVQPDKFDAVTEDESVMTYDKAIAFLSPKGTPFSDLGNDQLQMIAEKTDAEDRKAAALLIIDVRKAAEAARQS